MAFWSSLDVDVFGGQLQKKLENEVMEGIQSLSEQLGADQQTKFMLERVAKRARDNLSEGVKTLILMYKEGVFVEPPELPRKFASSSEEEAALNKQISTLALQEATLKAELRTLHVRQEFFSRSIDALRSDLTKLGQLERQPNLEKISALSRDGKRLRHLTQCIRELRDNLTGIHAGSSDMDKSLRKEQRGMASVNQLRELNARMDDATKRQKTSN